jgi:hypothetical protein
VKFPGLLTSNSLASSSSSGDFEIGSRYLSLFKYNAEGRKGLMKEKAAAREAALKLTVESAGGRLELINWAAPGSEYLNSLMLVAALRFLD